MKTESEKIVSIIENWKGDDLYRAQMAFRNLSVAQMNEQYGQSGQTCAQIVEGYRQHNAEADRLIAWVKARA
jgi:hypothetical protein